MDGTNIGNDYAYNANGALTKDQNKGITKIEYDLLGNPKKVTLTDSRSIEYVYSADGRRLRAVHKSKISSEKTDYVGGLILKNGKPEMYRFSGGYYDFKDDGSLSDAHYYIADYLGNNRMVVNASTDEVEQINHYYAYGGIIGDLSSNEGLQEFKFGDKKLDRTYGLDLYDFEARQYDAITPWFTSIDPLAEKFTWLTPYNYCSGNPVMFVDPDGRDNYRYDKKSGNFYLMEKTDDKTDQVFRYKYHKKTDSYEKKGLKMEKIEKGILKDKANFKNSNQIISIGGEGSPSVEGVKDFALQLSEMVGKEISGLGYSSDGSGKISDIEIGHYANKNYNESFCSGQATHKKYGQSLKNENFYLHFHTHPNGKLGATLSNPELSKDVISMNKIKPFRPNISFIVIYRSGLDRGYERAEYDYTNQ